MQGDQIVLVEGEPLGTPAMPALAPYRPVHEGKVETWSWLPPESGEDWASLDFVAPREPGVYTLIWGRRNKLAVGGERFAALGSCRFLVSSLCDLALSAGAAPPPRAPAKEPLPNAYQALVEEIRAKLAEVGDRPVDQQRSFAYVVGGVCFILDVTPGAAPNFEHVETPGPVDAAVEIVDVELALELGRRKSQAFAASHMLAGRIKLTGNRQAISEVAKRLGISGD